MAFAVATTIPGIVLTYSQTNLCRVAIIKKLCTGMQVRFVGVAKPLCVCCSFRNVVTYLMYVLYCA